MCRFTNLNQFKTMILQTKSIQLPSLETCEQLKKLGLKPPKSDILQAPIYFNAYVYTDENSWNEVYPICIDDEFEILRPTWASEYVFAPTADQLLQLVTQVAAQKGIDFRFTHDTLPFGDNSGQWFVTSLRIGKYVPENSNFTQYLADVLIFLLTEKP